MRIRYRRFFLLALALVIVVPAWAGSIPKPIATGPFKPLKPTSSERAIERQVVNRLQTEHYNKIHLDSAFSRKLLNFYLDNLDPSHTIFLKSDVQRFRRLYGRQLASDLKSGNLWPAFDIYNTYEERRILVNKWVLGTLRHDGAGGLDLSGHQTLLIKRKKAPWPASDKAQETLWKRILENRAIAMRVDGLKPAKVHSRLLQRYRDELQQERQSKSMDAFMAFMDAYTHSYDPHTDYFSPARSENFKIDMRLSLQGIGAEMREHNDYPEIVRLVPGGPASKSGKLQPTDRIVAVGQGKSGKLTDVVGMRLDEVVQMIRGAAGSDVRLQIIPQDGGATHIVTITRARIRLKDQAASDHIIHVTRHGKRYTVGVIKLPSFYIGASRDVHRLLDQLKQAHVDGVIMDLRNNGGGALQEAVKLVGLFIRTGPVVQIRDADNRISVLGDRNPSVAYGGPLAVLVNRLSASASEIFTGAIKDYGRGLVLGSRTFGKGTVQTLIPLSQGQLKLTEAKFYRVSGDSTQDRGVLPDIAFPSTIDPRKIGESALPNALPWDKIAATRYPHSKLISRLLPKLKAEHKARIAHEPGFQYLVKRIHLARQQSHQKTVSLNLAKRIAERDHQEQQRLALANSYRKAEGKAAFKNYKAFEKSAMSKTSAGGGQAAQKTPPTADTDPYLFESAHILADMIAAEHGHGSVMAALSGAQGSALAWLRHALGTAGARGTD